jgi:Ca-activated chloride channel family protein
VRFSHPWWLAGTALAVVVAVFLVAGAFLLIRASRRFGDEARVAALVTDRPAGRRALKGVLTVLAVAIGFVALAQPQYGRGTRIVPATNLDVVIVLDYSKSMYAKDVTPSRTERAKSEVSRLIADLPGARFGAVAFAGEPVSFPLTSDGAAIGQFFRQMSPADMPVGGTAIARALDLGLDLLRRDPVSARHRRMMVLVTDGEDLEGDPVSIAEAAVKEKVTIHVVQIGGRTPEPIPDVDENGNTTGWRKDENGQPLTTSLSAAGEAQLGKIAETTGGNVVRSERGTTGISEVSASMRKMMTEELTEKVETVYADVYMYPSALAFLLLVLEAVIPESSVRRRKKSAAASPFSAIGIVFLVLFLGGCENGPFRRHSPVVDDALKALDGGDPGRATELLSKYLSTGECKAGELGTPEAVRALPNASLDLGLALFRLAERFGQRFGDDAPETPQAQAQAEQRRNEVECALHVVRAIANDGSSPLELRAKAHYLTGNLEFLRKAYEEAVVAYDAALKLSPAQKGDPEDSLGARAAWNRAIALRRIEDAKKPDGGKPPEQHPDGGSPGDGGKNEQPPHDGGKSPKNDDKKGDDKKDDDKKGDDKKDPDQKKPDQGKNDQKKPDDKSGQNDAPQGKTPPQQSPSRDDRMLDALEQAPTVQQESAKRRAGRVRGSGMEDK